MEPRVDMTGQRFGKLVVIRQGEPRRYAWGSASTWSVRCDCGAERVVLGSNLRKGFTQSCGCTRRTHGMWRAPEYKSWSAMQQRCSNPNTHGFENYGGRGIKVDPAWLGPDGFANFMAAMGPRPSIRHSLDRIDVNGDYAPSNCRWASSVEQAANRRDSQPLEFEGETLPASEWARRTGIPAKTIRSRLRRGWTTDMALTAAPG
jgi:hypothetical protein